MGGLLRIVFSIIPCRAVLCKKGGQLAFAVAGVYNEANFGPVRAKEEGEMDLTNLALIGLVTLCASYIQSVTGFGFGIFAMMFLPSLMLYTEANVLSSTLSLFTSLSIAWLMRRHIHWKNILFPLVGCLAATYGAVAFVKTQENDTLMLLLGAALFLLSLYFFFFSGKIRIRPTWYAGLIAGLFSGILGGLFSIGGPPVVIYFLQSEEDSDHYMATLSAYFVFSGIINVVTKVAAGFFTGGVWIGLLVGGVGMVIGSFVGKHTREKTKPDTIRKLVYGFMAVSGAVHVITALV